MRAATWARAVIARGRALGPVPTYGSPGWSALPPSDPRAVAAVAVAAECWRQEADPACLAERLRVELAAEREVAEREAAEDLARLVDDLVKRLTYAALCERRGEPERAARARARSAAWPTVADLRDVELVGEGR